MGQSLDSMTKSQSRDELLHQLVVAGNIEAIRTLCKEGANLEWIDKEGKTPLIIACMDSGLFPVANTLIEFGANVNVYRPGRHAGTPLHHAAKRGLEQTVKLLLSSGANALVRNDDCLSPLDVARIKGHTNVVRAIEDHLCLFSGWVREIYGLGFVKTLAPRLMSRKIWVVVVPCGSSNPLKPLRLELAVYPTLQDAEPRSVVALWTAKIEFKFPQSDPYLIISTQSCKTRYKFASANEGDKLQLNLFYDACRGIRMVIPPATHHRPQSDIPASQHPASGKPAESATVISSSIQSATDAQPLHPNSCQYCDATNSNGWQNFANGDSHNGWGPVVESKYSVASSNGRLDEAKKEDYNGWGVHNSGSVGDRVHEQTHSNTSTNEASGGINSSAPSAPPIPDDFVWDEEPIHYPSIDFGPVSGVEHGASTSDVKDEVGNSSSCIICLEAPVEGACIPCGHMAGCMACLSEMKAKKGVCPVCHIKIEQIVKLYAV